MNDVLILPLLKAEIQAMAAKLEQLNHERLNRQQERDKMQQRLFEAESTLKQLATLEDLRIKKENLDGQRESYKKKEAEAELAKKAALLASQEELCHRLKSDYDALTAQVAVLAKRITQLKEKLANSEREHQKQLDQIGRAHV